MLDRLRALFAGIAAGILWGVVVAWWHDAPLAEGAGVGLRVWGPIVLISLRWRSAPAWLD